MKKLLAILLIAAMLLPCLPVVAVAEDAEWDMDVILDAFDKDSYRTAYESLLADGSCADGLSSGDKNATVKTLQKILKAFGQDVSTDGKMDSDTIKALNKVQKKFGLEKTDYVGSEEFARLLVCLLIYNKGTKAEDTLLGAGVGEEEYLYYLACYQVIKKQYYRAKCNFEASGLYDAYERAMDCEQDWPKDGRVWKSSSIGSGTKLTVKVQNSDSDTARAYKIYNSDKKLVAVLFIGGNGKASTSMKPGKYYIKCGIGDEWYGRKDCFGNEGYYYSLKNGSSKKFNLTAGSWELTVGGGYGNVDQEYEDYDNF